MLSRLRRVQNISCLITSKSYRMFIAKCEHEFVYRMSVDRRLFCSSVYLAMKTLLVYTAAALFEKRSTAQKKLSVSHPDRHYDRDKAGSNRGCFSLYRLSLLCIRLTSS